MRKFFYIRVSSYDQSIERQLISAKELGIPEEYIFVEKASGKDFKRPEYQLMKRVLLRSLKIKRALSELQIS